MREALRGIYSIAPPTARRSGFLQQPPFDFSQSKANPLCENLIPPALVQLPDAQRSNSLISLLATTLLFLPGPG